MIAKIIAYGRTREEALARLRRAMASTTVVIEGGACNKSFVLDLLAQPEVVDGTRRAGPTPAGSTASAPRVGWSPTRTPASRWSRPPSRPTSSGVRIETARLLETAHGGRPSASHQVGAAGRAQAARRALPGLDHQHRPRPLPRERRLRCHRADRRRPDGARRRRTPAPRRRRPPLHLVTATHGPTTLVEVDGVAHRVSRDEGGVLRSPAPALVVATPVAVGDEVEAGAAVVVLESMKMETVVHAPFAARVKELLVITGSQVETGAALIKLEPRRRRSSRRPLPTVGPALDLPRRRRHRPGDARSASPGRPERGRARLRRTARGPGRRAVRVPRRARRGAAEGESSWPTSCRCSTIFADLAELTRNRPVDEDRQTELRVHSSREHFHTFLQSLDVERGGLPEQFRERLVRVLGTTASRTLDRTPELEAAVFRIFLAQQRTTPEVALVVRPARLAGAARPRRPGELAGPGPCGAGAPRSRPQSRYPAIGDLARSVRFRWFDQPAVDAERSDILLGRARRARGALGSRRRRPTGHDGSRRWRPSPSRSCASWPSGSSTASRLASRCWRCWRGVTTASTPCTTCSPLRVPTLRDRPWSRATRSTSDRPGWCPRSARWASWPTRPATSSPR